MIQSKIPNKEFCDILAKFFGKGVGPFQGLRTTKQRTKSRPLTVTRTSLEFIITNKCTRPRLCGLCVWFSLLALWPKVWYGLLIHKVSGSHTTTRHNR